jgi:hypothetical protein
MCLAGYVLHMFTILAIDCLQYNRDVNISILKNVLGVRFIF